MTEELVEREAARAAAADAAPLLRVLDILLRLHAARDDEALLAAADEAFTALIGAAPALVRVRNDAAWRRRPLDGLCESAVAVLDRAARQGLPVLDPLVDGAVAIPIPGVDRAPGAVYVAHRDPSVVRGRAFELLRLVASHVGIAASTLDERADATMTPAAAGKVAGGVSLAAAKREFERRLVEARLRDARGNVAAAARALDVDRGQLARLMKRYGLDRAVYRPPKRVKKGQGVVSDGGNATANGV